MSMIPADLASRLRLASESTVSPVTPAGEISDKLSDLVPGERVVAEIKGQLPNGAYRAMVAQRELVLALPFSAKSGDSLELEVVENNGRIALALLTQGDSTEQTPRAGVTATLSQTGQLISTLLGKPDEATQSPPAALNGGAPILQAPPTGENAAPQLAQALQQAVSGSGMFYEAHQAKWVGGQLPRDALLAEPQGQLSRPVPLPTPQSPDGTETSALALRGEARAPAAATQSAPSTAPAAVTTSATMPVAAQTAQLVQQQLAALASQVFTWQGQVWPGQDMRWEISEEDRRASNTSNEAPRWQTRLHLQLPALGGIDAELRLQGSNLSLQLTAQADTGQRLQHDAPALRQALANAGLTLTAVDIRRHEQG